MNYLWSTYEVHVSCARSTPELHSSTVCAMDVSLKMVDMHCVGSTCELRMNCLWSTHEVHVKYALSASYVRVLLTGRPFVAGTGSAAWRADGRTGWAHLQPYEVCSASSHPPALRFLEDIISFHHVRRMPRLFVAQASGVAPNVA